MADLKTIISSATEETSPDINADRILAWIAGSDTLEGLVREMLRPMLAEWLDAKLPAMVERLVAAEIERITARN